VTVVHLGGVALLAALLPLGVRWIWRTSRLGPGPLRDRLVALGRAHGVRFRDVLVWHTHSDIANGAVVGIVPFARYVLLTETLLNRLPIDAVEAVMAHEVGHARRWHIPWLMGAMIATLTLAFDATARVSDLLAGPGTAAQPPGLTDTSTVFLIAGAVCIAVFGFVSRRFELQADAFATQHLSGFRPGRTPHADAPRIAPDAAASMMGALSAVAHLNHSDPRRFTMRHGSIRWRQSHLSRLVGLPADALPIDRTVRVVKWVILIGVVAMVGMGIAGG